MKKNEKTPVMSVCVVAFSVLVMIFSLCHFLMGHVDTQIARLSLAMAMTAMTVYATLFKNKLALILLVLALVCGMVVKSLEAPFVVAIGFYYFAMLFKSNPACKETMRDWILGIFRAEEIEEA